MLRQVSALSCVWLTCALACSRDEPPAANTVPELLAQAPGDWDDFRAWADVELRRAVPEQPLPLAASEPAARFPVLHLEERSESFDVRSSFAATAAARAVPVARFGPFRGDRPGGKLRVIESAERTTFEVSRVSIPAERVGSIAITLRQPQGRHFDLGWALAGVIRVPVPSNDRDWTLRVDTEGLAQWQGNLRRFWLNFPPGAEPVEIREIVFEPRLEPFRDAAGVRRVSLEREARSAVYAHTPAEIRIPELALPPAARLRVGLGSATGAALRFAIEVEREGVREPLLARELPAGAGWMDVELALDAWAGRTITLVLRADGPEDAVALWGNPVVYEPASDAPLVVIYLVDTLAATHLGSYGYGRQTAPTLRALAERGTLFRNAFAGSPRTLESVADLLLSLPASQHGVHQPSIRVDPALVTLPEQLRSTGFATASFVTNVNAGPRQHMDQGFDAFFDRIGYWWQDDIDRTVPLDAVQGWLRAQHDRPRLLYIHTAEPHAPYRPPAPFRERIGRGYRGRIDGSFDAHSGFERASTPDEIAHVVSLYDAEVSYADARLGEFLALLAREGLTRRAQLFVTADHGEAFLEHGHWQHGHDLHAEVLRVPLVAVGPGILPGVVDLPVQLYDLMPTVLALQGLAPPYPLAGQSLVPLLRGASADGLGSRRLFASNHAHLARGLVERSVLEGGRWKLMYRASPAGTPGGSFALFDLEQDPGEQDDRSDTERERARELIAELVLEHRRQRPLVRHGSGVLELGAEQLEQLKSLGYLD